MADVFVSYASVDRKRVEPIVDAIEQAGFSVWWDRRIDLGSSFDREIERELEAASCVVVIWSAHSIESEWVRNEAQEGLERSMLLPILIEDVRPPLAFRRTQAAQLIGRVSSKELGRIVAAIEAIVTGSLAPDSLRNQDSPSRNTRLPLQLVGAAVVAIILAAGFWWSRQTESDVVNQATDTITQRPASVMCQNMVQNARFGAGSLTEMLNIAEQALELDPTCSGALAQKAHALSLMAEFGIIASRDGFSRARDAAEQALALDSNQPLAHTVLGSVHMRIDFDFQKAMDSFTEAERLGATTGEIANWKQDLLLNAGRYTDGLALQLQEERENPRDIAAKIHTARFFIRLNRYEEARRKLAEALELDTNGRFSGRIAAIYLDDLGDIDKAQMLVDKALVEMDQLPPLDSPVQGLIAQIAFLRGDQDPLRVYSENLESGENFPLRSSVLSNYNYELGSYEKHIRWFSASVEERASVSWVMDFMNYRHPDYWQVLDDWVAEVSADSLRRAELLKRHKRLVEKVTEKMRL